MIEDIPLQPDKVTYSPDDTIRIKVTNKCPFQCEFCHHEGSARTQDMVLDSGLIDALDKLRRVMNLTQAHLTGGEPTAYPQCTQLIKRLKSMGFIVKMTSNGQFPSSMLKKLKSSGLESINFSIHTLSPIRLGALQRFTKDFEWGTKALLRQLKNLKAAQALGLKVKINTVIQHDSDIFDIMSFCKAQAVELRILDDLSPNSLSIQKIVETLSSIRAVFQGINITDGASGYSYDVISEDGFKFRVKGIRKNLLRSLCGDCHVRSTCTEWYYGLRLEQSNNTTMIRLCLHRQEHPAVQTLQEFFHSEQYRELTAKCS